MITPEIEAIVKRFGKKAVGFRCTSCGNNNVTWRVKHIKKDHYYRFLNDDMKKAVKSGVKESTIDQHEINKHFYLKMEEGTLCAHCDEPLYFMVMLGQGLDDYPFTVCINDYCPYQKKNNNWFYIGHFVGTKKKYHCRRHRHNSDLEKCKTCKMEKDMNRRLAPVVNKIFRSMSK